MDVGTWCVGDEVSEKLGEVEPDVLQRGQVAVTLPLQVDPSPVYVLHKRLGQAVVTGVQHCCLTGVTIHSWQYRRMGIVQQPVIFIINM